MLILAKIETQLKPKLFKKDLLHQRILRRGESSSYNILLLRYLDFKSFQMSAKMVAY